MWIVGLCFRFVKTGSPARRAGISITICWTSNSKCTCTRGYRRFPPSGKNRGLKLAFSKPNLSLISTWSCGSVVPDCLWATYRFPAVLCSRVSFRFSVRQATSRIIVRDSTIFLLYKAPYPGARYYFQYDEFLCEAIQSLEKDRLSLVFPQRDAQGKPFCLIRIVLPARTTADIASPSVQNAYGIFLPYLYILPSAPALSNSPPAGGIRGLRFPQQAHLSYKCYACKAIAKAIALSFPLFKALFLGSYFSFQ